MASDKQDKNKMSKMSIINNFMFKELQAQL